MGKREQEAISNHIYLVNKYFLSTFNKPSIVLNTTSQEWMSQRIFLQSLHPSGDKINKETAE